jgi:hypothetical protein
MSDETPEREAPEQALRQPEEIVGNREEVAEERCVGGAVVDAVAILGAAGSLIPVAKDIWDEHQEQKPDAPEIILPPGTEKD